MWLANTYSRPAGCPSVWSLKPSVIQKLFSFVRSHLLMVDHSAWAMDVPFRKSFSEPMILRLFPTFSSVRFSVYVLMLMSSIRWRLSLVQGDKYRSIWILLHTDSQCDQCNFLKMLSLTKWVFLDLLSKIRCPHMHIFKSVPLVSVPGFVPTPSCLHSYSSIVWFEVGGWWYPTSSSFIIQDWFSYPGLTKIISKWWL